MKLAATLVACLALASGYVSAQVARPQKFGDFYLGKTEKEDGLFATTQNGSNAVFGRVCVAARKGCIWVLVRGAATDCDVGKNYVAEVTTGSGSFQTPVACFTPDTDRGRARYVFTDYATMSLQTRGSRTLGIALSDSRGNVQTSHFRTDQLDEVMARQDALFFTPPTLPPAASAADTDRATKSPLMQRLTENGAQVCRYHDGTTLEIADGACPLSR